MGFREEAFEFEGGELGVDAGGVLDGFGADTKAEGGECFGLIEGGGGAIDYESCAGVSTEGFLEDSGEFGVAVGDVFDLSSQEVASDKVNNNREHRTYCSRSTAHSNIPSNQSEH